MFSPVDGYGGYRVCGCLGGLKKLSVEQNIEKEDIEGLLLESIGGYFDSPAEVAEAVEDAGLLKEICFHSGVETLDGLENFPALEMLYIDYCELSDLKPLVQIPGLKSLKLDGLSEVKDFSPLGTMKIWRNYPLTAKT